MKRMELFDARNIANAAQRAAENGDYEYAGLLVDLAWQAEKVAEAAGVAGGLRLAIQSAEEALA